MNRYFNFITASLLLVLFLALPAAAQKRSKFVSVSGKDFIAPDGRVLHLKGIGIGNWLLPEGYMWEFKNASSPFYISMLMNQLVGEVEARRFWKEFRENFITREDVRFIKNSGFNTIRIAFNYRLFVSADDPGRLEGDGYFLLKRVIDWCRQEKLYVILDMHGAPGGQTGDNIDDSFGYPYLFENRENQELAIRIWQKLAAQYKNEPTVLAYELLNEPIATYFDKEALNPKLEPLYREMTAAIRKVDKEHIIILGGAQWNMNFDIFGPPFDPKLAYAWHKYGSPAKQEHFQKYRDFADKYNVPVWLGETGENTDEWIRDNRLLAEQNGMGWCFWTYKRLNATATIASIPRPAGWDDIVKFAAVQRGGLGEVRANRPPVEKSRKILRDFLDGVKLKNCRINEGYLKALGLK
ncbi:MAG: cellulase family glycosylhydrolase [Acidobacteria bacterium]|nr:cellulase family glycosylhydrolase [Acidobacteriota bacterium]